MPVLDDKAKDSQSTSCVSQHAASSGSSSQPVPSDSCVSQPVAFSSSSSNTCAAQSVDALPACAGIGDPDVPVWACWDCLSDLCGKKPKMPLDALANDNWIGREKVHAREASKATKMLASLGRCCWKQVRLGKGSPDVQQKGVTGNTIFFAQPTADIPSMELPPPVNALVDSVSVIFTRNMECLTKAWWATVKREEYLRIVRERKAECATFANVVLQESEACLLYTSPSPRDQRGSRMPSSA